MNLGFTTVNVATIPAKVQAERVTLEFSGIPERAIPAGGYVRLTAPDAVNVHTTGMSCWDVFNRVNCNIEARSGVITIEVPVDLPAHEQFQYSLIEAVDNPVSSQPTDSFSVRTSAGETETGGIILEAIPGIMTSYLLTPVSQVVGESTQLEVRWSAQHTMPKDSLIFMEFPVWNPEAPIEQ